MGDNLWWKTTFNARQPFRTIPLSGEENQYILMFHGWYNLHKRKKNKEVNWVIVMTGCCLSIPQESVHSYQRTNITCSKVFRLMVRLLLMYWLWLMNIDNKSSEADSPSHLYAGSPHTLCCPSLLVEIGLTISRTWRKENTNVEGLHGCRYIFIMLGIC